MLHYLLVLLRKSVTQLLLQLLRRNPVETLLIASQLPVSIGQFLGADLAIYD
jgi:hypothetical protein